MSGIHLSLGNRDTKGSLSSLASDPTAQMGDTVKSVSNMRLKLQLGNGGTMSSSRLPETLPTHLSKRNLTPEEVLSSKKTLESQASATRQSSNKDIFNEAAVQQASTQFQKDRLRGNMREIMTASEQPETPDFANSIKGFFGQLPSAAISVASHLIGTAPTTPVLETPPPASPFSKFKRASMASKPSKLSNFVRSLMVKPGDEEQGSANTAALASVKKWKKSVQSKEQQAARFWGTMDGRAVAELPQSIYLDIMMSAQSTVEIMVEIYTQEVGEKSQMTMMAVERLERINEIVDSSELMRKKRGLKQGGTAKTFVQNIRQRNAAMIQRAKNSPQMANADATLGSKVQKSAEMNINATAEPLVKSPSNLQELRNVEMEAIRQAPALNDKYNASKKALTGKCINNPETFVDTASMFQPQVDKAELKKLSSVRSSTILPPLDIGIVPVLKPAPPKLEPTTDIRSRSIDPKIQSLDMPTRLPPFLEKSNTQETSTSGNSQTNKDVPLILTKSRSFSASPTKTTTSASANKPHERSSTTNTTKTDSQAQSELERKVKKLVSSKK